MVTDRTPHACYENIDINQNVPKSSGISQLRDNIVTNHCGMQQTFMTNFVNTGTEARQRKMIGYKNLRSVRNQVRTCLTEFRTNVVLKNVKSLVLFSITWMCYISRMQNLCSPYHWNWECNFFFSCFIVSQKKLLLHIVQLWHLLFHGHDDHGSCFSVWFRRKTCSKDTLIFWSSSLLKTNRSCIKRSNIKNLIKLRQALLNVIWLIWFSQV